MQQGIQLGGVTNLPRPWGRLQKAAIYRNVNSISYSCLNQKLQFPRNISSPHREHTGRENVHHAESQLWLAGDAEGDTKVKHLLKNYYGALSYRLIISRAAISGYLPDKACIRIFQANSDEFISYVVYRSSTIALTRAKIPLLKTINYILPLTSTTVKGFLIDALLVF